MCVCVLQVHMFQCITCIVIIQAQQFYLSVLMRENYIIIFFLMLKRHLLICSQGVIHCGYTNNAVPYPYVLIPYVMFPAQYVGRCKVRLYIH